MSEVITFYSYKGGVGRTMSLANVSVVLSKWGHKVLVVDWDLAAPGLEHFYKDYIPDLRIVETLPGVIDLLQFNQTDKWQDGIISVSIPQSDTPIHIISSGRRNEHYFKRVRNFDVDEFYENEGGEVIEKLRNEWLANYDYILIDSRTGITEIGGICTIQLPDTVVMLFTATNQGFEGVLDIIKRAGTAQQKLPYDRQRLFFLPIPSKFETNTEFKLSQQWLEIFANKLEDTYNNWLPAAINRKDFLELSKIPYISYFSFGEKLPVIEQGMKDPSGLGYAYETLAALLAHHLNNVDWLFNNRDQYIAEVNGNPSIDMETKRNNGTVAEIDRRIRSLKQHANINEESVRVIKSKEVLIDCLTQSILPLLEIISFHLQKFNSLFKSKNEFVLFKKDSGSGQSTISGLNHFINKIDFIQNNLNHAIYTYIFSDLRNNHNKVMVSVTLTISFLQNVFEIQSDDKRINVNKLYHEIFSIDESESIALSLVTILSEKIELALQ